MSQTVRIALPVFLISILIDQITKIYMRAWLTEVPGNIVEVLPILNWRLLYNPGISFSLFGEGAYSRWILTALAVVVAAVLLWSLRENRGRLYGLGVGLVAGGAIGNAIDRVYIGAVVDFIDLHWGTFHPFIFNIADTAISVGVVCLLIDMFFGQKSAP